MRTLFSPLGLISLISFTLAQAQTLPQNETARPWSFYDSSVPYRQRIADAVKYNLIQPKALSKDAFVLVEVSVDPQGIKQNYRIIDSSGSSEYEAAVELAMIRLDRVPLDAEGKVPEKFRFRFVP